MFLYALVNVCLSWDSQGCADQQEVQLFVVGGWFIGYHYSPGKVLDLLNKFGGEWGGAECAQLVLCVVEKDESGECWERGRGGAMESEEQEKRKPLG